MAWQFKSVAGRNLQALLQLVDQGVGGRVGDAARVLAAGDTEEALGERNGSHDSKLGRKVSIINLVERNCFINRGWV